MRLRMKSPRCGWLVVAALATAGCSTTPLSPERDALASARARWERAGIIDYAFEFRRLCFCPPSVVRSIRVEVLNGSVDSAVYVDTGESVSDPNVTVPTIEDLFDEIQDAIDRGADSLEAQYDSSLGYPISVSIDYIEQAVDDEMAFTISAFDTPP